MSRDESAQIEVLRVLCIISMMWVHVSPSLSLPSVVNGGTFDLVGDVLGRTLGLVSVTTLSFISGYLMWQGAIHKPLAQVFRHRFRTIMVPMLCWSAIFILLAVGKEVALGRAASAIRSVGRTNFDLFNAWTGLAGKTGNDSLFFLRDLFVASLILRILAPMLVPMPAVVIGGVAAITVLNLGHPVLFRPSILLFMVFGAVMAQRRVSITTLSKPVLALGLGFALSGLAFAAHRNGAPEPEPLAHLTDIFRRLGVGFLFLALTAAFIRQRPDSCLVRLGRHSFLAYLIHASVIGILWVVWTACVGDEKQSSYLVFYILTPFLVFWLAVGLGRWLDRANPKVQILLRGKAARGDPRF